ncbi:hypothetical protein F4604DRAFT_688516 [Suillus subluteus]|nr:hypothetical protein F4604DRAFT_688516 [Suillus subluteus]
MHCTEAGWSPFRRHNKVLVLSSCLVVFVILPQDTELMKGAFPLLVENCDPFLGMQMMHDVPTFGGFPHAFLTSFCDELNFSFIWARARIMLALTIFSTRRKLSITHRASKASISSQISLSQY